jgi:hypothetical protein
MVDRTMDETLAAVTAADTRVDGIIEFSRGLKTRLDAALAGTTIPPAVQAKINQIFDLSTADATKVDAAIVANT